MRPPDEDRLPDELLVRVVGGLDEAGTMRWGYGDLEEVLSQAPGAPGGRGIWGSAQDS